MIPSTEERTSLQARLRQNRAEMLEAARVQRAPTILPSRTKEEILADIAYLEGMALEIGEKIRVLKGML